MSLLDELAGEAVVGKVSALVHRGQALILLDDMVWKVSACAQCHWVLHAVLQAVQRMHPCVPVLKRDHAVLLRFWVCCWLS
eukprot:scaffold15899_cov19-Tisochrysis_lutea.AAC.2